MEVDLVAVAKACAVECERQSVGVDRLAMLIAGYAYVVENSDRRATENDVLSLVGIVEPSTGGSYRSTPVTFANGTSAAQASTVADATNRLFSLLDDETDADEFCHAFLRIHPFFDGNGRVAFLLRNWLLGTLVQPQPLPDYVF